MITPEILAPAGDFISLQAAIDSGADAVYLGLGHLNMRSGATANFNEEDLPEISGRCRDRGVKLYLTLNTIIYEHELAEAEKLIVYAAPYIDAMIVSDWAAIELCKKHNVTIHLSTQMSCSNSLSALFLKRQGAERIVLARECSLEEIREIIKKTGIEIEVFVHGAQCVAQSGRCLMSQSTYGCSANRGECRQPCRRTYLIQAVDRDTLMPSEGDAKFVVEPHTVLSAKDLCALPFIDKLMEVGISSFKIEGRARNATYVKVVTSAYRKAVDAVISGTFTDNLKAELMAMVEGVFHREFGPGLFFSRTGDTFTNGEKSAATTEKRHVGVVIKYYPKAEIAQFQIQDHAIKTGDLIQIHGPKTGVVELFVGGMRRDEECVQVGEKGTWVTLKTPKCHINDKVFIITKKKSDL